MGCNPLELEEPGSVEEFVVVVVGNVVAVLKGIPVVITVTIMETYPACAEIVKLIYLPDVLHCTSAGFGVHWPVLLQVILMGSERNSPSSHWKVTVAPSVVLDTELTTPLEGNSGWPQSTSKPIMENHNKCWPRSCTLLTCAVMECWIR